VDHLPFRSGLPADARRDVVLAGGLDGAPDQFQHGGVEFVEGGGDSLVVPVDGGRVLRDVVGAETCEVDPGLAQFLDVVEPA